MAEVWQSEPPAIDRTGRRGKYDWDEIVADLQSRPGEWRLIDEEAGRGLPSAIKRRKMTALQDEGWTWHVTTRNNDREARTAEVWMMAEPVQREGN